MKRIVHVGAWNRNYGDYALQAGLHSSLRGLSKEPLEFVPVDCQNTRFHGDLVDHVNATADMLLVGGGGLVFNRPEDNSVSGWQFNIEPAQLERLKIPLVVYGIGYNKFPFDRTDFPPQLNAHLRATQEKAALFSVRNRGTYQELVRRGLREEAISIVPDPGMFVPTADINLPGVGEEEFLIGLNWAGDRPPHRYPEPAEENERRAARAVAEALDRYLATRGGGRILLISHLLRIDGAIGEVMREILGDRLYVVEEEMPALYPPSYVQVPIWAGLYRRVDVAIGMRGHANIIPFGLGTPFIGIGTHDKNRFFAADVGFPDRFIGVGADSPAAAADRLGHIIEATLGDGSSRTKQRDAVQRCSETAAAFNGKLLALLG